MRGRAWGLTITALLGLAAVAAAAGNGRIADRLLVHRLAQVFRSDVSVSGARLSIWPRPSIVARNLRIGSPGAALALTSARVEASIPLSGLFGVAADLGALRLDRPILHVVRGERPVAIAFARLPPLQIIDGTIDYVDPARAVALQATDVAADVSADGLDRRRLRVVARLNGQDIRLTAVAPSLAALASGDLLPASAELDLPGLSPGTLHVAGHLEAVNGGLHAKDVEARIGATTVAGSAAVDVDRAHVQFSADFAADRLDASGLPDGLDLRATRALDATLRLAIAHAQLGAVAADDLRLAATLQDGGLRLHVLGGTAGEADIFVDTRATPPRVRLQIDLREADLHAILPTLGITGRLTASTDLQGSGERLADVLAAAHGTGTLTLREGVRLGPAWMRALGGLSPGEAPVLDTISGRFRMAGGAAQTCDLALAAAGRRVQGCGRLDLPTGLVSLDLAPTNPSAGTRLRLEGPWSAPQSLSP